MLNFMYRLLKKKNMAYLSLSRQQEIQRVIDSIPAITGGVSYPESNLIDVAEALGANVIIRDLNSEDMPIDGAIMRSPERPDSFDIFINSSRPDERKLFTLAHEIGHMLLKHNGDNFRVDRDIHSKEQDVYESEANFFAAALLMPEKDVIDFILSDMSVGDMAKVFKVSHSAAKNRKSWVKNNSPLLKGFF